MYFFRVGIDPMTEQDRPTMLDVETQALMRLSTQIGPRVRDDEDRERSVPLCLGSCDCLAEDVLRLLAYQEVMPRSVLVEYLKALFALHLALYHLRLSSLLPALVASGGDAAACNPAACPGQGLSGCRGAIGLLVDVANQAKTPMAELAEQSAEHHYRRTHALLKAYFQIRKLADFADQMERANRLPRPESAQRSVSDILLVLAPHFAADREAFFKQRLFGLLDHLRQAQDDEVSPVVASLEGLNLDPFDKYIEVILALRGEWQRQYIVQSLDSLLLKNRDGAMLAQPRTKNAKRRFIFDSRMIEVLLQILVVDARDGRFVTRKLHLDEVVSLLATRYGIYIDRLPNGDGFSTASIADRAALRGNLQAFKGKLRDIGFLRDLSDAYTSLTITPRYDITGGSDA